MAKWIWMEEQAQADSYGEFLVPLLYRTGKAEIKISADSDYTLYVNGVFAGSNQYRDFPHYKIYDTIDITPYLQAGENHIAVEVWYYGAKNLSYYLSAPGLWYEILLDGAVIAESNTRTLSRKSRCYLHGAKKEITSQLGFTFHYDATKADQWKHGCQTGFGESFLPEQKMQPLPRPIARLCMGPRVQGTCIAREQGCYRFDLGREEVGFLTFRLCSQKPQTLLFTWGEHLADGHVRRCIGKRDFSVQVSVPAGTTSYTNYFRRLGARYLEVFYEQPLSVDYVSVLPCTYPLKEIPVRFEKALHNRIYETAVRTLELCMHDHYEDCPWREQAMYAMDSRNQMLCGYYAFGEYTFPRAALLLMSKDRRADHLLSMCTPSSDPLTIPSFGLHYFTQIYEYTRYSGDTGLAREVFPKLLSVLEVYEKQQKNGLLCSFTEPCHWNFYEWAEDLNGKPTRDGAEHFEAALNCLYAIALQKMQDLADMLQLNMDFRIRKTAVNKAIRHAFYREDSGLFINRTDAEYVSELVNSLAILCGAATGETAAKIAQKLTQEHDWTKISLSMSCFKYDALLLVDQKRYAPYILADIEKRYGKMLNEGATSFWETDNGEADFGRAGSLCHGWSAMPVYYLHMLSDVK